MIASKQWKDSTFERMFNTFKSNHPEFRGMEYFTLYDATYVKGFEATGSVNKIIGRKDDFVKWSDKMFEDHMLNVLSEYTTQKGTQQMYQQQDDEKILQRARKEGEEWGEILIALNPKLPQHIVTSISLKLAKLHGFTTLEAGMEFSAGIYSKLQSYLQANAPQLEQKFN